VRAAPAATAAVLLGCASASDIETTLRASRAELMYLHDAPRAGSRNGTISLQSFAVDGSLPPDTTVERTFSFVVPLLIVNVWWAEYRGDLGARRTLNDCAQFMRESLIVELQRSARFTWVESGGETQIDVRVTKIGTAGSLWNRGGFLFLIYGWWGDDYTWGEEAEAVIEAEVVVRRPGKVPLGAEFQGKARVSPFPLEYARSRERNTVYEYTVTMVEALSLAVKDLNDQVVAALNDL
jgi:hypothetical protein